MYGYFDGLDIPADLSTEYGDTGAGPYINNISVWLPDLNLFSGATTNINVNAIVGKYTSYTSTGTLQSYSQDTLLPATADTNDPNVEWNAFPVTYVVTIAGPVTHYGTLINLSHTRPRCPLAPNNTGLPTNQWLYNTEYIPCSPDLTSLSSNTTPNFTSQPLTYVSATAPKNTARWEITLLNVPVTAMYTGSPSPSYGSPVAHEVDTLIGQNKVAMSTNVNANGYGVIILPTISNGVTYTLTTNQAPPNLSRTYFWVENTSVSGEPTRLPTPNGINF